MDLQTAVQELARVEGNLLLVDDFLNHRVDPIILSLIGNAFASEFEPLGLDLILTAEASGIPPALATALAMRLPMVYAKKYLGPGGRYAYAREVVSATKGMEYRVEVARRALPSGLRVAIIDDFLSGGRTAEALGEIVEEAGSEVATFGFAIEKTFMEGRSRLEAHGWRTFSLVAVSSLTGGEIVIEERS